MTSWINRSDEALMDMRKKLATATGANSSESTMIPPQIQGWLLLHRARLRDQDIGVMTMTGGDVNIKLVEISLLDLFTEEVLQSVDRSHGKDAGIPRKQHAFEAVEEIPEDDDDATCEDDFSENDNPYVDEDGNLLATEEIVSDIDDDLAIDDEEYHEALLGYREARDLLKEARVARGFYSVVAPIRSDKPTGRGKGDSSGVKNLSGKTGRGKGGRVLKGSGRSLDSRGRGKKGKGRVRSGPLDGTSGSQVCFKIIGHVLVPKWTMAPPIQRNAILEPTPMVRGPAVNPDNFCDEKCLNLSCDASNHLYDSMCLDLLCGAAFLHVGDDECEAHAAFLMEFEGFGVLDCGATTSFGSEALFSKSLEHDTRFTAVDPRGGRSFNFGDGASCKATSLSKLPVLNDALGGFWIPVHLFSGQQKPTPLMLGMDFLKEHRCLINCGEELIQFPMQSDCWWPLFLSSRGLYSIPLRGQRWEPSSPTL